MARLRYSDRRKLAEAGNLGDLAHDEVPDELAQAMRVIAESGKTDSTFEGRLTRELMEHFGQGAQWMSFFGGGSDVDGFLDAVEVLAEQAAVSWYVSPLGGGRATTPVQSRTPRSESTEPSSGSASAM